MHVAYGELVREIDASERELENIVPGVLREMLLLPRGGQTAQQQERQLAASHCYDRDLVEAMSDGVSPSISHDLAIPRHTWYEHKGTKEWVEVRYTEKREQRAAKVYWFDDRPMGGCRVPASWRLLYKSGEEWLPVENLNSYEVELDKFNEVKFTPVETTAFRIEVQLQPDASGGILEWVLE